MPMATRQIIEVDNQERPNRISLSSKNFPLPQRHPHIWAHRNQKKKAS
uniref:Uncharacterized protein n=1 Tax=Rhizophora mucronata TaxID=61149 RepID=A0A2P2PN65_RHIMU